MKYLSFILIIFVVIFIVYVVYNNKNNSKFHPNSLSGWNSYLVNVNDKISSIFLDFDLKEEAPIYEYPKLVWYWIKMKYPREDGLSSEDEFNSLIMHEEKLDAFLSEFPIVFAGSITTEGRREFYFYTHEDFKFENKIKEFVGTKASYLFQTGEKMDKDWKQYLELLYPSKNQVKQILKR